MTAYKCLEKYNAKTELGQNIFIYIMEAGNRKRCKLFAKPDLDLTKGCEYVLQTRERVILSAVPFEYKPHPLHYSN